MGEAAVWWLVAVAVAYLVVNAGFVLWLWWRFGGEKREDDDDVW